MALSKERQGEIALLYLKDKLAREGVRIKPNMKRDICSTAKAIGVSKEEAMEFAEMLVRELVNLAFKKDEEE